MQENNIFPFLWMRGESEEVIRTEMEKISESNIRAVCLEAKAASGASIRRDRVTAAQMEALETHSRLGALALVVVWLEGRGVYAVPWELWRDMKEKTGRASLSYRELEPYRAPLRQGVWDFLRLIDDGGVGR